MDHNITLNDQAIIAEVLRRRGTSQATYPEASVRQFLEKIGAEIQQTGELRKEAVDRLLQQLHAGDF